MYNYNVCVFSVNARETIAAIKIIKYQGSYLSSDLSNKSQRHTYASVMAPHRSRLTSWFQWGDRSYASMDKSWIVMNARSCLESWVTRCTKLIRNAQGLLLELDSNWILLTTIIPTYLYARVVYILCWQFLPNNLLKAVQHPYTSFQVSMHYVWLYTIYPLADACTYVCTCVLMWLFTCCKCMFRSRPVWVPPCTSAYMRACHVWVCARVDAYVRGDTLTSACKCNILYSFFSWNIVKLDRVFKQARYVG